MAGAPDISNVAGCTEKNEIAGSKAERPAGDTTCTRFWNRRGLDADAYDLRAHEAEERELTTLIQKIDTSALASGATHLHHGVLCSIPTLQYDGETRSEVAALQFLEKTKVPAPRVFDYSFEDADNPVGVGYILMENLPGTSLSWSSDANFPRRKIMDQLADICIEIQKYLFKQLGSLDHPRELHRAVDAYLVHRFLLDLVPWILPPSAHGETDFYLKHADDKGDHTLVDDDFNVTGIIDQEWAHTASAAHAFDSPIALLPVSSFYNGVNDLGDDEVALAEIFEDKGREDLAALIRSGRLQHKFAFCCGHDLEDWEGFLGLFRGLRDGVGVDGGLD
ncbi:uncharacterized protein DNG_09223 [Cephalotrichum gorgonifer]|uniref:Aminoglycoside phosphotransferase domain-containing protein n=1 Tax=Cephalotrichum gorgonifer TaxID=2041049 RepID=A0AAE8N7D1_9PEZI|nr:uncharacterized protein DNG_09223 [Cephalotrichum gorgonifer]